MADRWECICVPWDSSLMGLLEGISSAKVTRKEVGDSAQAWEQYCCYIEEWEGDLRSQHKQENILSALYSDYV